MHSSFIDSFVNNHTDMSVIRRYIISNQHVTSNENLLFCIQIEGAVNATYEQVFFKYDQRFKRNSNATNPII
jgi:hypothetical protein